MGLKCRELPLEYRLETLREIANGEYGYSSESLPELREAVEELTKDGNPEMSALASKAHQWLLQYKR